MTGTIRDAGTAMLAMALLTPLVASGAEHDVDSTQHVVTVLALDPHVGEVAQGSGVVIDENRIVTNCHVLEESQTVAIAYREQRIDAVWVLADPERDLCVIETKERIGAPATIRASDDVQIGERVTAIGNPLGFGLATSHGIISMKTTVDDEDILVTSAALSPGSSGGGLFDSDGRLIGISSAIIGTGQQLNLVLPAEWILQLDARAVPPTPVAKIPQPETNWRLLSRGLQATGDAKAMESQARRWIEALPSSPHAHTALGIALLGQQRDAEAEAALRQALSLDDRYYDAWMKLAIVLHRLDSHEAAIEALDKAKRIAPWNGEPYATGAIWLADEGRLEDAAARIREALRLTPWSAQFWSRLSDLRVEQTDGAGALDAIAIALKLNPLNPRLQTRFAKRLLDLGDVDRIRRGLESGSIDENDAIDLWLVVGKEAVLAKQLPMAEQAYTKVLDLDPNTLDALSSLGSVYLNTNRVEKAIGVYSRIIELDDISTERRSQAYSNRSVAALRLGDMKAATRDANKALALWPKSRHAHQLLSMYAKEARNYAEAARLMRKAIELGENGADSWAVLAEALELKGDREGAEEAIARAEQVDSENINVLRTAAAFYGRGGNLDRSLRYIEKALTIDSADAHSWSSKGYALIKLRRYTEAIEALKTATSLDPDSAKAQINLGEAQMRARKLGDAIKTLTRALALAPNAQDARLYLSQSYLATHQPKKAIKHVEHVLRQNPNSVPFLSIGLLAYLSIDDRDTASRVYEQLQKKNPERAESIKGKAIAMGLVAATSLPE